MDYTGYKKIILTDDELARIYQEGKCDKVDLVENEYLAVVNKDDEVIDKFKMKNGELKKIPYYVFGSYQTENVKPKTFEQHFAMDLLQDRQITVKLIRGVYGSGKDYLMSAYAAEAIEKGWYDKIIYIRPNVTVKDVPEIGFLPNDLQSKLAWTLGPLIDKFGGEEGIQLLTDQGKFEMAPLLFLRGRSFENCLIYVSEGQNITTEIAKLLLGRVGEGSTLIINGDTHQTDRKVYENDNGVLKMIERLTGNKLFGYVYLSQTLRSATANLANLLDD